MPKQPAPTDLAAALLAAAERGAAAVGAGPVDDIGAAERAAFAEVDAGELDPTTGDIRAHHWRGSGPNGEWTLADYQRRRERHLAELAGLMAAALLRPPSWSDPEALPSPGARFGLGLAVLNVPSGRPSPVR
ncbi:MAG: hypothetical protein ACREF1_12910 [Acetobacteraceae bacterium]